MQIQSPGFKDSHSLNDSFAANSGLLQTIENNHRITQYTERIESFALAASGDETFGAMIFGIVPEKEEAISGMAKFVRKGSYLKQGSKGVVIGKELAQNLNITVNDTLVLIGQGYHGISAAGKFPVEGILDSPLPSMDKQAVYMDLGVCSDFFSLGGKITSIVLMVNGPEAMQSAINSIEPAVPKDLKIYSWKELQPALDQLIRGKLAGGKIVKGLLFMIIAFGIWGTIIMLMAERKRELGIMIALGVKKIKVIIILIFESFFIGLLGIVAGACISFPIIMYFYRLPIRLTGQLAETYTNMGFEPLLAFSIGPSNFIMPAITVLIIFAVISIYPVWYIGRLRTSEALRA